METSKISPSPKRWIVSPLIPASISAKLRDHSPFLRQLLFNRGIKDPSSAQAFVEGQVCSETDPFLIKDMEQAVELIHEALHSQKKIVIYGDYDADGVTSSTLLYEFLTQIGAPASVYIPNRFDEGYGLNSEAIESLASKGTQLLITVDCGIRSIAEVALARELGMQVILSDHHLPGNTLPPANAIINPRQPGDYYPYKELAGVGIAYKIVLAYLQRYPQQGMSAAHWLDLVAIGTIADIAPLDGENRALVKQGLEIIRHTQRQGLYSLCQIAGIKVENIDANNIGFGIAPRLNAAGRLDDAMAAFELLTNTDLITAGTLAQELDAQNSQRKDMTLEIQNMAIQAAQTDKDVHLIFAASPDFNEGVVGLAASRVVDTMYRPTIIGYDDGFTVKASCRSIPEFDITRALDRCSELLERYGGHSMAAGFTVKNTKLPQLLERLKKIAAEELGELDLVPELVIDYEVSLERLRPEHIPGILEDVAALEPTGRGNPSALFSTKGVKVKHARTVGDGQQHLKLVLQAGNRDFDAIGFRQGYWLEVLPDWIDIAFTFETNTYQGRTTLQLNIKDLKASEQTS